LVGILRGNRAVRRTTKNLGAGTAAASACGSASYMQRAKPSNPVFGPV
jgi:hypothetical protein